VGGALVTGLVSAGGLAAVAMEEWLDIDNTYLLLIGAIALLVTVVLNPEGIAGGLRRAPERLPRLLRRRPPPQAESSDHPAPIGSADAPVAHRSPAVLQEVQHSDTTA
jgi:hypothetical protein